MGASFDLDAPDHFTAGTQGPPGQRVFYLQGRESGTVVTLKCEKEQVAALAEYLAGLLARLSPVRETMPQEPAPLEPIDLAWPVGSIAVGYDDARDRVLVVANERVEEERDDEPAAARFVLTRAQAAAFVERARELMKAGRPICPVCSRPKDPGGHVCPRSNGYAAGRA
ncbi:MAG: DUF3090 family protein [Candidatus Rokubacteria bacterium]|nr:DUF3090 family protein [Candidatus Rokubacteria bacterium]